MKNFNDDAIREAAYYIWKNNGCQANTGAHDWNAAINQLNACATLKSTPKKAAAKASATDIAKAAVALKASVAKAAPAAKAMPKIVLMSKKSK